MKTLCIFSLAMFLITVASGQTSWEQRSVIQATKQDVNDNLGWSVDITENFAIVGAYQDRDGVNETPSTNYGSAYIIKRNPNNTWTKFQKIVASDPTVANFGYAVA